MGDESLFNKLHEVYRSNISNNEYKSRDRGYRGNSPTDLRQDTDRRLDSRHSFDSVNLLGGNTIDYDQNDKSGERRGAARSGHERDEEFPGHIAFDDFARSRDRQSARSPRNPSRHRDYDDDTDRKSRSKGYGNSSEDSSGRKSQYSKSRDRDRDRDYDRRSRDRSRERRTNRDDSGYERDRDDYDNRSKRRSRSRDRDRDRDRRYRDSDRDRRHRDSDRDRHRRERDRDRGDKEASPKDIPWVPPPLPEHLRHLQVQWALTPVDQDQPQPSSAGPWVPPTPPVPTFQNQFQNDGSFMELFRQKMQQSTEQKSEDSSLGEGSASSSTAPAEEGPAAAPPLAATSSGLPVIARRRISKILKTGTVQKKKKEEEEETDDKEEDGWSSYMKEVQKYRANKCIENEASRPPLVK